MYSYDIYKIHIMYTYLHISIKDIVNKYDSHFNSCTAINNMDVGEKLTKVRQFRFKMGVFFKTCQTWIIFYHYITIFSFKHGDYCPNSAYGN